MSDATKVETLTHIAGPRMTVCDRVIQRCAICGFKLCDSLGVSMPLNPDGSVPKFACWEPGRMVRETQGMPTRYEMLPDTHVLPTDSCIDIVE